LTGAEPKERAVLKGHTLALTRVLVSPDGKLLASSGSDGRVLVWDAASGKKLQEWQLPGHVDNLVFAPDSRHLATGNGNGTIYVLRLHAAK
jgi:WD40 repeat protein